MFGALAPNFLGQGFACRENGKQMGLTFWVARDMAGDGQGVGWKGVEIDFTQSTKPLNLSGNRSENR